MCLLANMGEFVCLSADFSIDSDVAMHKLLLLHINKNQESLVW